MIDERIAAIKQRLLDSIETRASEGHPIAAHDVTWLIARLREAERERDHIEGVLSVMQLQRDEARRDWGLYADPAIAAERDAARAREKRAYTLLVSVLPAAKRQERDSPNETALRLNRILVDAIQEWVDEYLAAHVEAVS